MALNVLKLGNRGSRNVDKFMPVSNSSQRSTATAIDGKYRIVSAFGVEGFMLSGFGFLGLGLRFLGLAAEKFIQSLNALISLSRGQGLAVKLQYT